MYPDVDQIEWVPVRIANVSAHLRPFLPESGKSRRSNDTASQDDGELNLERIERRAIERAIRESGGNMTYAAEKLGITRFALYRKIEKYKL